MDGYKLKEDLIVPASYGIATFVEEGQCIEIVDVEGKQVGDFMAWVRDRQDEWFSPAHTVTQNWRVKLNVGDLFVTNWRRDIFKLLHDDVGYHDIVVPCCDQQAYIRRYGINEHRSCLENIREALGTIGENRHLSGELAWNMFMKNRIGDDGEMIYEEPIHVSGSKLILEALNNSVVALSACPQDQTPTNGWSCSKMRLKIWELRQK